jgi:hypothetical protein
MSGMQHRNLRLLFSMRMFAASHWVHQRRPKPKKVEIKATAWSGQVFWFVSLLFLHYYTNYTVEMPGSHWILQHFSGLRWMSQCLSDLLSVNFRPAFLGWSIQTSRNQAHFSASAFASRFIEPLKRGIYSLVKGVFYNKEREINCPTIGVWLPQTLGYKWPKYWGINGYIGYI